MKGHIKANTTDKYLRPIRKQIIELIESNTSVIEFGCGNGDLLFQLDPKIQSGLGIDKSKSLISYASNHKSKLGINNLDFKCIDLENGYDTSTKFNYSVTSLLFHILPWTKSVELLKNTLKVSETSIICGFAKPKNTKQNLLLWLDQRFNGHYSNFRTYKQNGFTEGLIKSLGNIEFTEIDTSDPVIKIYVIHSQDNSLY